MKLKLILREDHRNSIGLPKISLEEGSISLDGSAESILSSFESIFRLPENFLSSGEYIVVRNDPLFGFEEELKAITVLPNHEQDKNE